MNEFQDIAPAAPLARRNGGMPRSVGRPERALARREVTEGPLRAPDTALEERFLAGAGGRGQDHEGEVTFGPAAGHPRPEAVPHRNGKARNIPVEEAIISRYLAGECNAEETLLEIYHAAISMHRAEAVARTLWGARLSVGAISTLNRKIATRTDLWRTRSIRRPYPYVFLGRVAVKHRAGGQIRESVILVAVGVSPLGFREVLGVAEDANRDGAGWRDFLELLKKRGLAGVRLFVSDPNQEAEEGIAATFPEAAHQVCLRQLEHDVLTRVPTGHLARVTAALDTVLSSESAASARQHTVWLVAELKLLKLPVAARILERAEDRMASYYAFPRGHWKVLRSNFPLMRILRQIRERARVIGPLSDSDAAVLIVSARLRFVARLWSAARNRLTMGPSVDEGRTTAASPGLQAALG